MTPNLFFLLLIIVPGFAFAQSFDSRYTEKLPINGEGKVEFVQVSEVDSLLATDLFSIAEEWFVKNYNSANDVIQMRNQNQGVLIGKGVYTYSLTDVVKFYYDLHYTIKIEVKNERYRVTIGDLYIKYMFNGAEIERLIEDVVGDDVLYKNNGKPRKGAAQQKIELMKWVEEKMHSIRTAMSERVTDDW